MRAFATLLLFLGLSPALLGARPGRYVVFEIDRNDHVSLVDSREVMLADEWPAVTQPALSGGDPRRIDVEVLDERGAVIQRTHEVIERAIRFEADQSVERVGRSRLEQDRTAFVVRMPREGTRVEIRSPRSGRVAQFDTRAMAADALPGVRVSGNAANSANRLDLLIVGDGYTAGEATKFEEDADRIEQSFFSIDPYGSYRSFVNVSRLFVASPQSGADHPNCADGGPDPKEGTFVNTAFDATYCTSGIQRLLTVSQAKVLAAAASVPDWDKILVIVNDTMYGGAGGLLTVASTHDASVPLMQHEFAHAFTGLADEYSTPFPGFPPCSDKGAFPDCEANVTDETLRSAIKWSPWIDPGTEIPSPPSFGGIGLFAGARYQTSGFYRPKNACMMRALGDPFCEVCSQAYVLRLYGGWTGSFPARRVRLIENEQPSAGAINIVAGQSVAFSADVLRPDRHDVTIQWLVDGVAVLDSNGTSFSFLPPAGKSTVELRVTDPAPQVHPAMAGDLLTHTRKWTVTATEPSQNPRRRSARP